MLYAFLTYDEIRQRNNDDAPHMAGRVFFWIGAVGHVLLTTIKMGEWISRRMELEHVHAHWMIYPVGLAVAAMMAPIIGPFAADNEYSEGTNLIARFYFAFAYLMWIVLFAVTFLKVVTTHNSDDRVRHGVFIWLAAPCVVGLADYMICLSESRLIAECNNEFASYYFIGIFLLLSFFFASLPGRQFFGVGMFDMGYWIECFSLDVLAACGALFYAQNGYQISQSLQFLFLTLASIANLVCFLHTLSCIARRRGVFTPEVKWGPLSFMKLTHEAFRGAIPTLKHFVDAIDVEDDSPAAKDNLELFAAHFSNFFMLHAEHARHEDEVIFKTFNDYFSEHAQKYNDDHEEDHEKVARWTALADKVLDTSLAVSDRKEAANEIKADFAGFMEHFEEHLRGEEDNLQPIGRKYLPLAVMKDISRKVWEMTDSDKWERILPFIINNLPRHPQRVRYLKVLCWSMPERAQQFGAIVYRNVDSVMWARLSRAVPEIIPRGAPGYSRYY